MISDRRHDFGQAPGSLFNRLRFPTCRVLVRPSVKKRLVLVLASWIIDIAALFVKLMSGAVPKKRKAQFQIGVEQKGG